MESIWYKTRMKITMRIISNLPVEIVDTLSNGTNIQYLDTIAHLALDPRWTAEIYRSHKPIFVDLCNRWTLDRLGRFDLLEAVAALTRLLPVAPFLSIYLEELIFQRESSILNVLRSGNTLRLSTISDNKLITLLNVVNRLLDLDNHKFASMISPGQLQVLFHHSNLCIKYMAIKALCVFLHAGDALFLRMVHKFVGQDVVEGPWEDRDIDYMFFRLWEEQRVKDLKQPLVDSKSAYLARDFQTSQPRVILEKDLSPMSMNLAGVLLPNTSHGLQELSSLVMTETTRRNLHATAEAVLDPRPLLITGLSGSGKTSIVQELARSLNKASNMLTLHLNEQTDAKLLLGMYTSTTAPGSFRWQPGVLTTAVMEGRWVLIEDLDRAPTEIISAFLPLLERGELIVPNLGGSIRASEGFKLIATIRSSLNTRSEEITPGTAMLGLRFWNKVHLSMLSNQDLNGIILGKFPIVRAYQPSIIALYKRFQDLQLPTSNKAPSDPRFLRAIGPHELLRFAARLQNLLEVASVQTEAWSISDATADDIFMEAVDCFACAIPFGKLKSQIVSLIAQELHVAPERARYCTITRVPTYSESETRLTVGRVNLSKRRNLRNAKSSKQHRDRRPFATTNHSMRQLESISATVSANEPCLLVGETGTGKTTLVQELAKAIGRDLVIVNLSQQSEAGDLLGGFKPVNLRAAAIPMQEEFEDLFESTFKSKKNEHYTRSIGRAVAKGEWARTVTLWQEAVRMVKTTLSLPDENTDETLSSKPKKRRKIDSPKIQKLRAKWAKFGAQLVNFQHQIDKGSSGFRFSFIEGNIVKAVRNGDWVLLDEINLATPDTLECLADLLSDEAAGLRSITLSEAGDIERVHAHPDFRIFGAMNPATDIGKKDLPLALRGRFMEHYIEPPDNDLESLKQIIHAYLGTYVYSDVQVVQDVAQLYLNIKHFGTENRLVDGANQKPHFSLRTLTRTLMYVTDIAPLYGLRRALFEGLSMSFLTVLNKESEMLLQPLILAHLLGGQKNRKALLYQVPKYPADGKRYVQFRHYWVAEGLCPVEARKHYIITPFIERNLMNLVRATSTRRFPVLLQGPTSSGKTSMVEYLAKLSGNKFVRINNHEHTDLQEYIGSYISDSEGHLQYQEGILVRALREGHWIVLDELNLAPTDVLEALNRLLDDNRELLIPETQQVVQPHENFMLFATQNPPGMYGGRKILSRAFRNRFLELHFDDIPENELETIIRERTQIAPSFCTRIVAVYKRLAVLRQSTRLFEQKQSFATLRDLFRWAFRDADDRDQLAINGFMLLAERVRESKERQVVKQVIEEIMNVKIDEASLYSAANIGVLDKTKVGIVWTQSMRRLYALITQAIKNNEPILLVGHTGSGKTSICQAIAELMHNQLHIINAHQNTETGDLIGAQRPVRNRSLLEAQLIRDLATLSTDYGVPWPSTTNDLNAHIELYKCLSPDVQRAIPVDLRQRIDESIARFKQLFEWSDGSLVSAMRLGHHYLLDEISLADDSVLERLNSVLEPDRSLLLAERGPLEALVKASTGFQFLATMNPGGDFGKKELSPALRNRFTEIWVPPLSTSEDVLQIVEAKLASPLKHFGRPMVDFATWFGITYGETTASCSIRQILTWVQFLNSSTIRNTYVALYHGAAMVYIDGLGANPAAQLSIHRDSVACEARACAEQLTRLLEYDMVSISDEKILLSHTEALLRLGYFELERLKDSCLEFDFSFDAPTTMKNAMRISRALQLSRPILIEGNPGVGKTALVVALARAVGMPLTRINLSEQTDVMDLFGSDIPVGGQTAGNFAWRDAPFLQAMQQGEWVLLDEMNLASQSVLEGLNACLDHRGQVYVPELDQTFTRHPRFVLFAAQNPHRQGGGRKGLPASFVNRFTLVYADLFKPTDLLTISHQLYPSIAMETVEEMVQYVTDISTLTRMPQGIATSGGPWEFNLRDILRWLHLVASQDSLMPAGQMRDYQNLLFLQRLRSHADVAALGLRILLPRHERKSYHDHFQNMGPLSYQCGLGLLARNGRGHSRNAGSYVPDLRILESVMLCVQHSWPCLLVGPSGSGKTSLIHYLGEIVGADIVELPLTVDMDTVDLVGGYEQVDTRRDVAQYLLRLQSIINEMFTNQILSSNDTTDLLAIADVLHEDKLPNLSKVLHILGKLQDASSVLPLSPLVEECQLLIKQSSLDNRARFVWVDGDLVKALETGQWLILDNANLCSSSVLDRLNSLLEPNGVLAIHERHSQDGSVKVIRPHPNFRLFVTMDPRYGELSRSMRNRCIELFLYSKEDISQPLRSSTYPFESTTFRFHYFNSFDWNALDDSVVRSLASVCMDHLAPIELQTCEGWLKEATKGLVGMQPTKLQILSSVLVAFMTLSGETSAVIQHIRNLYADVCSRSSLPEDFAYVQTIHPLNNAPLLSLSPHFSKLNFVYSAGLLEIMIDIEVFKNSLISVKSSLQDQRSSTMSRLERSMLSNDTLAFTKDSTRPLAQFLELTRLRLSEWIEKQAQHPTYDMTDLGLVKQLLHYVRDVFDITQFHDLDEGAFQAYLMIGKSSAIHALACGNVHDLFFQFQEHLDAFKVSWELTSGGSLELLWSMFRPPTATTRQELNRLLRYEDVADRFDRLLWWSKKSIDDLTNLRRSIVLLDNLQCSAEGEDDLRLKAIEEAIASIESSLITDDKKPNPYFKDQFEGLRQFYALEHFGIASERHKLDLLAGFASKQSMTLGKLTPASRLLMEIENVTGKLFSDSSLAALTNVLPISILCKLTDISEVPLKSLDLLRQEVSLLAQWISESCEILSRDQYRLFSNRLAQIMSAFFTAHATELSAEIIEAFVKYLQDYPNGKTLQVPTIFSPIGVPQTTLSDQLSDALVVYIIPSLNALREASSEETQAASTAIACISFFTGCLHLYVPDRPFDPALKPMIERARLKKRRIELQSKIDALRMYDDVSTGESTSFRLELLKEELQALGIRSHTHSVYRPETTELPQLQGEFTNILNSIVRKSPSSEQVRSAMLGNAEAAQGLHLVRQNLKQAVHRLSTNHRPYDDLTKPIVGFLHGLDTGLALALVVGMGQVMPEKAIHQVSECTPFMALKPRYLDQGSTVQQSTDDRDTVRLANLRISGIEGVVIGQSQLSLIGPGLRIFQIYYEDWKKQLTRDQHEYSIKISVYRYRGSQEEDEVAIQNEFDDLFPEYDKLSHGNDSPGSSDPKEPQSWARRLAELHRETFSTGKDSASHLLRMISDNNEDIVRLWEDKGSGSVFPVASKKMMSGLILSLHTNSQHLSHPAEALRLYNFYVDANLSEACKLVKILSRIQDRFKDLRRQWPEHATLEDVLQTSNALLLFRHVEPIAKLITKCEQLHGYMHEWETVASREYSAIALYDELTGLLVSWRRLELSTWANLLDMEDQRCTDDAKGWWFVAYEAIIAASTSLVDSGEALAAYRQDLFVTLEAFLKQTSIGQFSERLRLLETFRCHLEILATERPMFRLVHDALKNYLVYYTRFEPGIRDALQKGRMLLEKDMKEVLLLASWKDTNIIALRESAKRSHHKLFKIIRKYRALLAQAAETTLAQGMPELPVSQHRNISIHDHLILTLNQTAIELCRQSFPGWSRKPKRYTDPDSIVLKMRQLATEPASVLDYQLYIETFCTDLADTITVLQKETPSVLTTENKDFVKHLKSRKRRLFADTLKEVREMGMTPNPGTDVLSRQSSLSSVLSATPAFSSTLFPDVISKAEFLFHRSLENMAMIRSLAKQHSEDLNNGEMARSIGLLESTLNVVRRQRAALVPAMVQLEVFQTSIKRLQSLWDPDNYSIQKEGNYPHLQLNSSLERCVRWLPPIIDVGITIIQCHNALRKLDSATVTSALRTWKETIETTVEEIHKLPLLPAGITSSLHLQLWADLSATLERFSRELHALKLQEPSIAFVLDQILLWTSPATTTLDDDSVVGVRSISLLNIGNTISTIVDTILVGTQQLNGTVALLPTSHETNEWLLQADTIHSKGLKVLHISDITHQLDSALSQLPDVPDASPQGLRVVTALFAVALPVIKQYGNLFSQRIERYLDLHASTCRMLCVLSTSFRQIVQQGFCSPLEKAAQEDGKSEKLEGGTGLGEGEGAEDISKDIQDDEDLADLAQEGRKEHDKHGIEDQTDAVDMNHDEFEGEMDEKAASEGEGSSDTESGDSRDDIDEEVGKVDDLGPSAVDEKLWDGSPEGSERDKESNKPKGEKQEGSAAQDDQVEEDRNDVLDAEEVDEAGVDEGEEVTQAESGKVDPYLQEEQNLDLPEEMDLNGDNDSIADSDDETMKDLSDIDQNEEEQANVVDSHSIDETVDDPDEKTQEDRPIQEDLDDMAKTEEAGTPVDTEPGGSRDPEDQGLLRDRTEDAVADADNTAQSDVRGVGETMELQSEMQDQPDTIAESNKGAKSGLSNDDDVQAEAEGEEGKSGAAASTLDTTKTQQNSVQDTAEFEAFKKLGDALEDWHRQSHRIHQPNKDDPPMLSKPMEVDNVKADFEHLSDENAKADTQALGAASEDQAHALEPRAFDSEMQDQQKDFLPDNASDDELDQAMADTSRTSQLNEDQDRTPRDSAVISSTRTQSDRPSQGNIAEDEPEGDIDELDNDLSIIHLATDPDTAFRSPEEARRLWSHYENLTQDLALTLTEQLRLILAPTLATKMRGDFRTGKRLNIKRIIPYIASQYKRDKIWMRRSVPSKRSYQIMLAVDDSKSMGESGSGQLAFETLALVSKSLSMLEVGQVCIVGFGNDVHVAHDFDQTFSSEAGVQVFQQFNFQQTRTNVGKLIAKSIELFRDGRGTVSSAGSDLWQLELIISDGVCEEHELIRRLVRQAHEERIMIVFVIVDSLKGESIMDMTQATFEPDGSGETKLKIKRYLDGFPFGYYLIVGDVKELPGVLATALRQWFAEVVESG